MSHTEITIAGETHRVIQPYEEGHVLSVAEAQALNQTYAENIRNNMAPKLKAHKDAGTYDADLFQSEVDAYTETYVFGFRPSRTGDPVMREALAIAKEKVLTAIANAGRKKTDYTSEAITAKAHETVAKYPAILAEAKERVARSKSLGEVDLEALPEAEAPVSKRGKKAA
jgi:hypothetical protein